ncbi:restriction endonuclease [Neorhizobium sp. T25_13]|uniref:restriction endonuclease n=1 Tax=Neorhizobium sp. T25_13 TaxID=2093830 RepID=UPI000CF8A280|nr:restriction endonuclease [Neorhizobium sp. T25_13]
MGTLIALFCENKGRFFPCAGKPQLTADGMRRILATRYRYCIGDNFFYLPAAHPDLEESDRLCWVRDREYYSLQSLDAAYATGELTFGDVRIGNTYVQRRVEQGGKFVEVRNFVGESLYTALRENPECLPDVSKSEFEALCAELFVRRGFEVDLFRKSKDGGIDFLAVRGDLGDPVIFAVQCKHPDRPIGKRPKSLGRPILQQIYGAAKAWDLDGAVAISSTVYSAEAKSFASYKPREMTLHDGQDILEWIKHYRWNDDE